MGVGVLVCVVARGFAFECGLRLCSGPNLTCQHIDQRRLAHVGAANNRKFGHSSMHWVLVIGGEAANIGYLLHIYVDICDLHSP